MFSNLPSEATELKDEPTQHKAQTSDHDALSIFKIFKLGDLSAAVTNEFSGRIPFLRMYHPYGRIYPIGGGTDFKAPLEGCQPSRDAVSPENPTALLRWIDRSDRSGWALRIDSTRFVVIDREHPNKKPTAGPDGITAFDEFCASFGVELPPHFTVRSGSGGIHDLLLFPDGLIPEGRYVKSGKLLNGVDLLTSGRPVILPGSRIQTWKGPGEYQAIAGFELGVVEMPRLLAAAIIEKMGLQDITDLGRTGPKKRSKGTGGQVASTNIATSTSSGEPMVEEALQHAQMVCQRNRYFKRCWDNEPAEPGHDDSRSGQMLNMAKVTVTFGFDELMFTAIGKLWCQRHGLAFKPSQCLSAYRKAHESRPAATGPATGEGEKASCSNSQVHKYPPTSDCLALGNSRLIGQWLPLPQCPDPAKQSAFAGCSMAAPSLAGNRADFDRRHADIPENGDWQRTRSYLIAVAYYALKVHCSETEVLWYLVQYLRTSSSEFYLTPNRLTTVLKLANRRLKCMRASSSSVSNRCVRQSKKQRKPRSDRGTGNRMKSVARLIDKGLGYRRIAVRLGIGVDTARDYCRSVRKYGGTDQILRPSRHMGAIPSFASPLAHLLHDLCDENGRLIRPTTANGVIDKLGVYARDLEMNGVPTETMIRSAVKQVEHPTQKSLVASIKHMVANLACEIDSSVLFLGKKIQLDGLLSRRKRADGTMQRNRYGFPTAVLRAKQSLKILRSYVAAPESVEDLEEIWPIVQRYDDVRAAMHMIGRTRGYRITHREPATVLNMSPSGDGSVVIAAERVNDGCPPTNGNASFSTDCVGRGQEQIVANNMTQLSR